MKTAKRLIKSRSSCLRLYNAYGIIEARAGRFEAANKVFSTAINMSRTLSSKNQEDTVLLWRTWVWEHIRVNHLSDAIHLLLSVGDEQAPTMAKFEDHKTQFNSSLILKVRNHLNDSREYTLSIGDYLHSVLYSELLALFSYFHEEQSLWAAMDSFRKTEQLFQSRGLANLSYVETLHQAKVLLISYHTSQVKFFKPAEIRESLADSIALFPNNTIFLTAYAINESRFRLNDRVRSILSDVVLREQRDTVIGWAFAILAESQRRLELGGTVHGVRAVFEKAIEAR
jgi:hypothetical protein